MTQDDARKYISGESIGADVPLNLMTYLTKPGDLIVDPFACAGAFKDAARHYLPPRWRHVEGRWVWWNHWSELDSKTGSNFPPDYWEVDHRRKCLQYDLYPNPVALEEFGHDFILKHDATEGVTPMIQQQVFGQSPDGTALVYLAPPYLSQGKYSELRPGKGKDQEKSEGNNLSTMGIDKYVRAMATLIVEFEKILAPEGRIALLMGTDTRWGHYFDPALAIFREIRNRFERPDQVPFEFDWGGPLHHKIWVPCHGFSLIDIIGRKNSRGVITSIHRYLWILRRNTGCSTEPLVE